MIVKFESMQKGISFFLYFMSLLVAMLMTTSNFALCSTEQASVQVHQVVNFFPQGIILVIAPYLSFGIYLSNIPASWKVKSLVLVGCLYAIGSIISLKYGIPVLEAEFGSAEPDFLVAPITFYISLAIGIMNQIDKSQEGVQHVNE